MKGLRRVSSQTKRIPIGRKLHAVPVLRTHVVAPWVARRTHFLCRNQSPRVNSPTGGRQLAVEKQSWSRSNSIGSVDCEREQVSPLLHKDLPGETNAGYSNGHKYEILVITLISTDCQCDQSSSHFRLFGSIFLAVIVQPDIVYVPNGAWLQGPIKLTVD